MGLPSTLYDRPQGNRRVMFLELIAWAIAQVEAPRSPAEFAHFERGPIAARMANGWGHHPWPGAKDHERFQARHRPRQRVTVQNGGYIARPGAD